MKGSIALAAVLALAGAAGADVVWDESIDGDLSSFTNAPTVLTFSIGGNTIIGNVGGGDASQGGAGWDVFSFTIGAGQTLSAIFVDNYSPAGNTTGLNIYSGSTGSAPGSGVFIDSTTMDPGDIGLDVLPDAGGPLGPGTYTIELREFGAAQDYQLTFQLVPAPASAALLGLGALVAGRRRR